MKKSISLFAVLLISISSFAQPGQKIPSKKKPDTVAAADTTQKNLTITYVEKIETVKARAICFGENNTVVWFNVYVISTNAVFEDGKKQPIAPNIIKDENGEIIKIENILNLVEFNWK